MVTRITALLLLVCCLSLNLSGCFVFAGFEMNKSYIASTLCENRNRPELRCGGKCYLMRKLRQAQEKEQKQEQQFQKIQLQQPSGALLWVFKRFCMASEPEHVPFTTGRPVSKVTAVFHPPQPVC